MIIDILDWDITYTELMYWISETGAELDAITGPGSFGGVGSPSTKYEFRDEEDFVMFKLKFAKEHKSHKMGYSGTQADDMGSYYCPYIPYEKSNN